MKKVLFIDRDGTIIIEPPDEQIDSFEKLEYYPGVFTWLGKIARETDYELVMVTNQDGLGTERFPEETFWPTHERMMNTLESEGIKFSTVCIDRSFPHENKPTRKPGTGMLKDFLSSAYDLKNSFVIGDRVTDVVLAKNLGSKGILINDGSMEKKVNEEGLGECCSLITTSWEEIYNHVSQPDRKAINKRITKETEIIVEVNLDGTGKSSISTGLGFFDHMLDQLSKHGKLDLNIQVKGDLHIDEHHTIEDTGLALGEAFLKALGDKRGIERYGFCLPMDDCLAQVALDFGGRPWIVWDAEFKREKIGEMPTEMFFHFFKSFSDTSKSNINIKAEGTNEHHKIEAIFKAFAKAVKAAVREKKETWNYHQLKVSCKMNLAIIKYNAGNIQSVSFALERLNVQFTITDEHEKIRSADKVIFPGVGEASTTMKYLKERKLDEVISSLKQPTLGICLGMQLMCRHSEEYDTPCLGIFDETVKKFTPQGDMKVPHMGWNNLNIKDSWLDPSLEGEYTYFVHSYYVPLNENTSAVTEYINPFSAAMHKNNFYAVQFHPEKSAGAGVKVLQSFLNV